MKEKKRCLLWPVCTLAALVLRRQKKRGNNEGGKMEKKIVSAVACFMLEVLVARIKCRGKKKIKVKSLQREKDAGAITPGIA
jgi:hypothetical protein